MLQAEWWPYASIVLFASISMVVGWKVEGRQRWDRMQRARLARLARRDETKRQLFKMEAP